MWRLSLLYYLGRLKRFVLVVTWWLNGKCSWSVFFLWWKGGFQEVEYYANINEFDTFLIFNLKSTLKDKLFKKFFFLSHRYSQITMINMIKLKMNDQKILKYLKYLTLSKIIYIFQFHFMISRILENITRFYNIRIHPFFLKIHIQFT